jgi:hypothetical protein
MPAAKRDAVSAHRPSSRSSDRYADQSSRYDARCLRHEKPQQTGQIRDSKETPTTEEVFSS